MSNGTVITGTGIPYFRLLSLLGRLKIEMKGMKFRGRSTFAIVKEEFNLKGNKQKVFEQFEAIVKEAAKSVEPGDIQEI
jgi:hypothetical protein